MKLLIYGGSFNPPHMGHILALKRASAILKPDKIAVLPSGVPPHKAAAPDSPAPKDRLELCELAFSAVDGAEVSDMELRRPGPSYTVDSVLELEKTYEGAELTLLIGADMLESFDGWFEYERILAHCALAVMCRENGDRKAVEDSRSRILAKCPKAVVNILDLPPYPAASSEVRRALPERGGRALLPDAVYARIIQKRLYNARPDFEWLRENAYSMLKPKRIPHVQGCEREAVKLALRWGADPEEAAEAGILHDITKKLNLEEQLQLCEKYGIISDNLERNSEKLLHSKTGAAVARDLFGVSNEVYEAIRWHTTGKADMSLLEKIIYMADYIEPTRDFEGVGKLRELAYSNLDSAMALGLQMSLDDILSRGVPAHRDSAEALRFYKKMSGYSAPNG